MENKSKEELLKDFMEEQFDIDEMFEIGFFKNIRRSDYKSLAERVCKFFGFETIYEYGAIPISCHLSYGAGRPIHVNESGEAKQSPFITTIESIYD